MGKLFPLCLCKISKYKSFSNIVACSIEDVIPFATYDIRNFWIIPFDCYHSVVQAKSYTKGRSGSPLCYEVDLVTIEKSAHPAPPAPPDVARPPAGARKSPKGVFYKVLAHGKGGAKPSPTDSVRVNYTGWTTDGHMFDSSVINGHPAEFSLRGVIAGWTDGIPLMSVGDKFRFWIPDTLAYKGQPDRPQGMLVFDIELLEIKSPPHPDAPPHGHP